MVLAHADGRDPPPATARGATFRSFRRDRQHGYTRPMAAPREPKDSRGVLDRLLAPFTVLHPGEGTDAVLLMLAVFLLLTAYYVLKVVREPLILSGGGAELKSYTSAGQAILLLFLIPAYSAIANRVNRIRLISTVTLFFISNLLVFYALALAGTRGCLISF